MTADEQPSVSLAKLPLSFVKNVGQADPGVAFTAGGAGYSLFFTPETTFLVSEGSDGPVVFSLGIERQNPSSITGEGLLPGKANFYLGNDPSRWYEDVPTYGSIVCHDALLGVDIVFRGTGGVLKREFILAPGADPKRIVLVYGGAKSLRINPDGSLTLVTPSGTLTEQAPVSYQVVEGARVPVASSFFLIGTDRVGFSLGAYDPSRELVIDPSLIYGSYLGGNSEDVGTGIAVDSSGNAYLTGYTQSSNFPNSGSTCNGLRDAFVTKVAYNGTWSSIVFSTYYGGNNDDQGLAIAVDSTNSTYITGKTASLNFPITQNAYQGTLRGAYDAFVVKFNPQGQVNNVAPTYADSYSTYLGGADNDEGMGIKVDSLGNAYLTGDTYSNNFPTVGQAFQNLKGNNPSPSNFKDAFVTKLDPTGSNLIYSTYLGGTHDDQGSGIALDSDTNAYIVGYTKSGDFPLKNACQGIIHGFTDAFVTKMNTTGYPVYSTFLGGYGEDYGQGIDVDAHDQAYVTGKTDSTDFPVTSGVLQPSKCNANYALYDAFATKLTSTGCWLGGGYSTYLGGVQSDSGNGIVVDGSGNAYVTGATTSNEFCAGWRYPWKWNVSLTDGFLVKLNPKASSYSFATPFGGCCNDEALAIALDPEGAVYLTGFTESADFFTYTFPTGARGGFQQTYGGAPRDAFIMKVATASPIAHISANSTGGCMPVVVNFTDVSTGGYPTSWSWNFDDGNITTYTTYKPYVVHIFPNVTRTYTVSLTVANFPDGISTTTWPVTVCNAPIPNFTASNLSPVMGQTLTFTDNTPGSNVAWNWQFATDTGFLNRSGQSVRVNINNTTIPALFTVGQSYWVNLSVTNACGCTNFTNGTALITPREANLNAFLFFNTTTNRTVAGRSLKGDFYISQTDVGIASFNEYSKFATGIPGGGQFGDSVHDQMTAPYWICDITNYFHIVPPTLPTDNVSFTGIDACDQVSYGSGKIPLGSINVTNSSAITGTAVWDIFNMDTGPLTEITGDNGANYVLTQVPVNFTFYNYPPLSSFVGGAPGTKIPQDLDQDGLIDDVRGDGYPPSLNDVWTFFQFLPIIQENWPVDMMDYNRDGKITVYDVYLMYHHFLDKGWVE